MPFEFVCPHCHFKTKVLDRYAGQSGPCVECGKQVTMPHFNERGILVPTILAGSNSSKKRAVQSSPNWMAATIGVSVVTTLFLLGFLIFWLAFPYLQNRVRHVAQSRDLENMLTIAEALNSYCDKYGSYPPVALQDASGKATLSWRVMILPFMGYKELYEQFDLNQPWDSPANMNLVRRMPNEYASPNSIDARSTFETNYSLITGAGTLFPPGGSLSRTNVDKNTVLLVETMNNTTWSQPGDIDIGRGLRVGNTAMVDIGGLHKGSFTAVTVDKDKFRIPSDVPQSVLDALITPNGGENVQTSTFLD